MNNIPASWDFYDCYDSAKTPAGAGQCLPVGDERLNPLLMLPFCGVIDGPALYQATESEGGELRCCYRIPPCVGGRPLVLEEALRTSPLRQAEGWG